MYDLNYTLFVHTNSTYNFASVSQKLFRAIYYRFRGTKSIFVEQNPIFQKNFSKFGNILPYNSTKFSFPQFKSVLELCKLFGCGFKDMNKTLVIYSSNYGHTKKYAQWLVEELNADICESENLKSKILNGYATILFGSSLYAGKNKAALLLLKHFEQIKDKKVVLFTCGLGYVTNQSNIININNALDKVITPEIRNKIKIFHVQGGIDYDNLSFLHKTMMKFLYSKISKKSDNERNDEDREFLATYGQKIDFSDKKMLEPIIQYCLQ
jgi:menaquinone-dependent protoporphyrinogen IX oxidase